MVRRLLPVFATIVAKTLKIEWSGEQLPSRAVVIFWHGKMYGGWWAVHKLRPVALVSKSKDGMILASVLERWGYKLARGSSGKNGREALEEAIQLIRSGDAKVLAITPDGPRGPRHEMKRGAFLAAKALDLPLFMLHIDYSRKKVFSKSWDRFEVPLPFSKVRVEVQRVESSKWPDGIDDQKTYLQQLSKKLSASW